MGDMIGDQGFDIGHDLSIARSGRRGHFGHGGFVGFMEIGGLGEEHKGDREEAFDPFDELVAAVSLGGDDLMSFLLGENRDEFGLP